MHTKIYQFFGYRNRVCNHIIYTLRPINGRYALYSYRPRVNAATDSRQIMPAGISLPERRQRAPIMPARPSDVPSCTIGAGGSWEVRMAP